MGYERLEGNSQGTGRGTAMPFFYATRTHLVAPLGLRPAHGLSDDRQRRVNALANVIHVLEAVGADIMQKSEDRGGRDDTAACTAAGIVWTLVTDAEERLVDLKSPQEFLGDEI